MKTNYTFIYKQRYIKLFVLCLFSSCVLCAQCWQCLWIVCPVSLDCPFLIAPLVFSNLCPVSCVPNVASVFGLSILVCPMLPVSLDCLSCVLCTQCCQCLWIVCPVSCVPNVASVSGLSILVSVPNVASVSGLSILDCPLFCLSSSCVLCAQCCQCLWIVYSWLPLVLVCLRPVSCVPNVASVSGLSILDCPLF